MSRTTRIRALTWIGLPLAVALSLGTLASPQEQLSNYSWGEESRPDGPRLASPAYPPHSRAHGKTLGQWGGEWWMWMGQFQLVDSPITDPDGSRGGADYQPGGPVWYLAGTFGGPAERWVEVPTGTALLFPLINWDLWSPEDCWWIGASSEPDPCSASDLQAFLNDFFTNHVTGLSATLDGEEIPNLFDYRATSEPFTLPIDPDTLWTDFNYTPGPRYPNVSDGYYVLLRPLRPGEHVLTFSAEVDNNPSQAVTYHLTVTGAR